MKKHIVCDLWLRKCLPAFTDPCISGRLAYSSLVFPQVMFVLEVLLSCSHTTTYSVKNTVLVTDIAYMFFKAFPTLSPSYLSRHVIFLDVKECSL